MGERRHRYEVSVAWTGNRGSGTSGYREYGREHEVGAAGRFTEVVLRPRVTVAASDMIEAATSLHAHAQAKCFIARSRNCPVRHEPVTVAPEATGP